MKFNAVIINLVDELRTAWNSSKWDELVALLDDEVCLITPSLILSEFSFASEIIQGKSQVSRFLKRTRNRLPLRIDVEIIDAINGRQVRLKAQFYELGVYSEFECLFSKYGLIQELKIVGVEKEEIKLSKISILKNVIRNRVKVYN